MDEEGTKNRKHINVHRLRLQARIMESYYYCYYTYYVHSSIMMLVPRIFGNVLDALSTILAFESPNSHTML
jgi:hypothetical protein